MTPHGEELVTETRQEVRQMAVNLWAALAKQPLEGHADTNLQVGILATRIDELYKHLAQQPLNAYDDLVLRIRELTNQLADLRTLTAERANVQAMELREAERRLNQVDGQIYRINQVITVNRAQ